MYNWYYCPKCQAWMWREQKIVVRCRHCGEEIKHMPIPKKCEECPLSKTDTSGFFGCSVTENIVLRFLEEGRPSWCPLG